MGTTSDTRPAPRPNIFSKAGIAVWEAGFSALDAYYRVSPSPLRFLLAQGGLADLARASDGLEYPGLFYADASIGAQDGEADWEPSRFTYICLADDKSGAEPAAFAPLDLLRDPARKAFFLDPKGVYPELRRKELEPRRAPAERLIFEAAGLLARYDYDLPAEFAPQPPRDFGLAAQRDLLLLVLTGKTPERALGFLKSIGFIEAYWPEIAALEGVDQAKEFHPEGDVWAHTMETFRYRKAPDFRLSLALLLHDTGKPRASASEGRRFDRHAEIGASVASRFLARLGFPRSLGEDVAYLVRYHMLPAALPRLPLERGIEGVDEPLFPLLLELYKCDELSTFKGPEGYYEACAAYRAHLRNSRNPYRNPEALRLAHIYLTNRA
jgi:poly(A) polymerase